jgi:hypothetical protein
MTLHLDKPVVDKISKPEIEQVEQEKMEYHMLGTFLRTRGLQLFCYNPMEDKVELVNILYSNTIHIIPENGQLIAVDLEAEKTTVDSRCEYFEALNMDSAKRRVKRWKEGKIKELFNLRDPNKEPLVELKFW